MKWQTKNLALYFQSQEYVDTLCIPLIPIELKNELEAIKLADQQKSLQLISDELERNFTGRIFLSPSYTYIKESDFDAESKRLNQWTSSLSQNKFQHIFFLTYDVNWKKYENNLEGSLIWLTANSIDDYQSDQTKNWIKSQINQISELIRSYW
ncbi:DUF2487 family protein [Gracilibacillus kekensis]|uniref:DUF2487 domain-containing protein n=1 Tax=Gracilibacillus kekensis TaxID=1027249 RepID=A0A1M7PQ26_9BACI|nr:DUF2487 family protein [Gracilibacillus kekensis]SHN19458.1 Protein of unknown function [Gracilibacillus kekensis]